MAGLDPIDEKIIRLLRADGRISNAKLAAEVGLSQSACLCRVQMLERNGVIRGYTALVEEPDSRERAVVMVQITLARQPEEVLSRFEAAVRRCPEVREGYLMTGLSDYLLLVETPTASDYERIHTEVLSRLPGVSRIQSSFAIRSVVRARPR